MLRVLHCIYDDPENPWVGGGGAVRVREIYRRLTDQVEVTVVTGNYPEARDGERYGVLYRRLGTAQPYSLSRLSYGVAATRLLAEGGYDVGLFDYSVYTPVRLPRHGPVGLVVHMLHGPTAQGRWGAAGAAVLSRLEAAAIRSARWISTTSDWMVERLRPMVSPDARIVPVGSGVPPEFAAVRRDEADYLLYYGRIDIYQKGLDTLLAAYGQLRESRPVRLVIAGRGKDADRLREMIDGAGLSGSVDLRMGLDRAAVLELMAGALALVMPSRLEGLPMVPAEAMAAGLPVIAANVGAMEEIVVPERTGLLVPPADPAALAEAMRRMVADVHLRHLLSNESRRSAERFSWDRVARAHLAFLNLVAGRAGDAPPAPSGE
jgi:glycosyltransferase involved in cell wall biosynthesis